jgi:hypothetical protein
MKARNQRIVIIPAGNPSSMLLFALQEAFEKQKTSEVKLYRP